MGHFFKETLVAGISREHFFASLELANGKFYIFNLHPQVIELKKTPTIQWGTEYKDPDLKETRPGYVIMGDFETMYMSTVYQRIFFQAKRDKKWKIAEKYGRRLLGVVPEDPEGVFIYGGVLVGMQNFFSALRYFERAVQLDPYDQEKKEYLKVFGDYVKRLKTNL
jgi:tetratricopeptide (TPR) repeat protein